MTDRPLLETGLFALDFARKATMGFLDGLEGDAFCTLFAPGGGNAAYIAGHIAYTDDMTLQMLAGQPAVLTADEQPLFGGGAAPSPNPEIYPPREAIIEKMTTLRASLVEYFSSLSDAELVAPVEGPLAQFGDTRSKLMASIAWHEGMHAGQLTVIRRQLDMPRVLG
ncbi:MAG: DinB family protein [Planctomycetota bacterium]